MIRLPEAIQNEMGLWRNGLSALPASYINFHKQVALADLQEKINDKTWVQLEEPKMVSGGWGDGMQVVEVVVAENSFIGWQVLYLKWHEQGSWMRATESGGQSYHCHSCSYANTVALLEYEKSC